jgi:hypothetical protein
MLQSDTVHDQDSERNDASRVRRRGFARVLEYVIAAVFVAILVYIVTFTVKVVEGVSRTADGPSQTVRLQVLNGCGLPGIAADVAGKLDGFTDTDLEVRVVDTGNFELMTVKKSFVISRGEDLSQAKLVATKLGLDPSNVIAQPLGHNLQNVSVTLVIGQDYPVIRTPDPPVKEK